MGLCIFSKYFERHCVYWPLLVIYKTVKYFFYSLVANEPKLYQLLKFKGQGKRAVKVIEQVTPFWEKLACSLHFRPAVIETINRNNHYQCNLACMDMFGHWLKGSGHHQPVKWETLIVAMRNSGERDLEKLARVLDAALLWTRFILNVPSAIPPSRLNLISASTYDKIYTYWLWRFKLCAYR